MYLTTQTCMWQFMRSLMQKLAHNITYGYVFILLWFGAKSVKSVVVRSACQA